MRTQAVVFAVIFSFIGGVFLAIGGELAGWWTVSGSLQFGECSDAAACAETESLGRGFAAFGGGFVGFVALLNVWWAFKRARARRIRAQGVRVPAVILKERRSGGSNGSGSSSVHYTQRWQAVLPGGGTTEFKTRSGWSLGGEGVWLEAAAVGDDAVLMVDVGRQGNLRGSLLQESQQAALALLRDRSAERVPTAGV